MIHLEPDWLRLPAAAPARVRVLLQRCLLKDPKQRLRDIGEARISLDEVLSGAPEPSSVIRESPAASAERARSEISVQDEAARDAWGGTTKWIAAAAALLLLAGGGYWAWAHTISERSKAQPAPAIAAAPPPELPAPERAERSVEKPAAAQPVRTANATPPARPAGVPVAMKAEAPRETTPPVPAQPTASRPAAAPPSAVSAGPAAAPPPAVSAGPYDGVYSGPVCYGETPKEPARCYRAKGTVSGGQITGQWMLGRETGITMFLSGDVAASGDIKMEMHSQKADGTPLAAIDLTGTLHDGRIDARGVFRMGRTATLNWHKNSRASR